MRKVVLFKSPSEDYELAFRGSEYEVVFVEPLQFEYRNLVELGERLQQPYDGVVFTSPRAVEAVARCWSPAKFALWNTRKVYTVGEASAHKIKIALGLDAVGSATGNAETLAELIAAENDADSKFLFPSGNLRSEILPNILDAKGIRTDSVTVYETKENVELRSSLLEINEDVPACMVFFSPSGCEYIYRQLQTFANRLSNLPHFAIGNSTAHKIENLGVEIAGIASKPKAECVLQAIQQFFVATT
ncbi:uroporphyrinogen-III synthase-like [Aricia agestis]|uniref:uroporphyrinogen-III synthase-like n=1 Tax=Aricia agestis TaxID=91739 RepID=UPI001C20288C|nr:uroporphyrinogen-III synthase-like [Aricia agestis]